MATDDLFYESAIEPTRPVEGNLETFLLTEDSIKFLFRSYEVAPYSAGTAEFGILMRNWD